MKKNEKTLATDINLEKIKEEIIDEEFKRNWVHHQTRSEHEIALSALEKAKQIEELWNEKFEAEIKPIKNGFKKIYLH